MILDTCRRYYQQNLISVSVQHDHISLIYLCWVTYHYQIVVKLVWNIYFKSHLFIKCSHPDSSNRLHRSHMTQYRWGYCSWEYRWGCFEGTLQLLWQNKHSCRSCSVSSKVPSTVLQLQKPQRYCVIWDLCTQSVEIIWMYNKMKCTIKLRLLNYFFFLIPLYTW